MSEDLIKREDAIKALRLEYPTMPMFKSLREEWAIKTEGFRKAEEVIMSIPSADRWQGEWIEHKWIEYNEELMLEMPMHNYECSKCHSILHEVKETNFCPNCGAKMKGAYDE